MGVGSIGASLKEYEECDTFLSDDAGLTWTMVRKEAHKYEFGDQGSIIVAINDEDRIDTLAYTTNMGKDWYVFDRLCVLLLLNCDIGKHSTLALKSVPGHSSLSPTPPPRSSFC